MAKMPLAEHDDLSDIDAELEKLAMKPWCAP
ncbi:hypothetical protein V1289_006350 [Bradyrhizobium sp. AZCC 2289]